MRPVSLASLTDVRSLFCTNFNWLNKRSFDATVTGIVSINLMIQLANERDNLLAALTSITLL